MSLLTAYLGSKKEIATQSKHSENFEGTQQPRVTSVQIASNTSSKFQLKSELLISKNVHNVV